MDVVAEGRSHIQARGETLGWLTGSKAGLTVANTVRYSLNNISSPGFRRATALLILLVAGNATASRIIDCAACHRQIAAEWQGSLHASSWTNPAFLQRKNELLAAGQTSCACHAPESFVPDSIGRTPVQRADTVATGIDCIACHMDTSLVAWSDGPEIRVPHWTRRSTAYSQPAFCSGCHIWGQAGGDGCQECHMPLVEGDAADFDSSAGRTGASHHSHHWGGSRDPRILAEGASLKAGRTGNSLHLDLTCLIPAHAFPQSSHHFAEIVVFPEPSTDTIPLWRETVRLAADSSAVYNVDPSGHAGPLRVELRYYPARPVWPDSFYRLESRVVAP